MPKRRGGRFVPPSRPARGAWIEIVKYVGEIDWTACRAPQGARGLKYDYTLDDIRELQVAPRKGRVD